MEDPTKTPFVKEIASTVEDAFSQLKSSIAESHKDPDELFKNTVDALKQQLFKSEEKIEKFKSLRGLAYQNL